MSVESDAKKQRVAQAALAHLLASGLKPGAIIGVGTGSTVNCFIDVLASVHERIGAAVSSSNATTTRLQAIGIKVLDLNDVECLLAQDSFQRVLHPVGGVIEYRQRGLSQQAADNFRERVGRISFDRNNLFVKIFEI